MVVKARIKFIAIVSGILVITNAFSQSSLDTIRIQKHLVEIALHTNYNSMNGSYTIEGKTVDKQTFELIRQKLDSISNIVENNISKYHIFLSPDNKVVEEGWWYVEFFGGYYKSYFPNGNVKEEGYYTEECDSIFVSGQKIGEWKYYNVKGKVIKTVNYTPTYLKKNEEVRFSIPPCLCKQEMLYKDRNCITIPPSKIKGVTYSFSSAQFFSEKINSIENDTLFEMKFLREYASEFMDSVYSKNECINDGVFVIKIFKHSLKDTLLGFSMSYIKTLNELDAVFAINYITIKDRKVLVVFSHDLEKDGLQMLLPTISRYQEDFSKYLSSDKTSDVYKGKYILHGNKIEATFSPLYYDVMSAEERIW